MLPVWGRPDYLLYNDGQIFMKYGFIQGVLMKKI